MGSLSASRKRKAATASENGGATEPESDLDFNINLDSSEGTSDAEEDDESLLDGAAGRDRHDDDDEEEDLDSDEIPSDGEDAKKTAVNAGLRKRRSSRPRPAEREEQEEQEEQEGEEEEEEGSDEEPNYTVTTDANGNPRYVYKEIDPVYDSDDSEAPATTNTIGNIPLSFYDAYPHIGYDINGKRIMRPARGEALDALLETVEVPKGWTGLTDPATGKPLQLSREELEVLRKIQMNEIPEDGYDPYPPTVEYFTRITEPMPLSAAPEPKRRFVPSQHEARRVLKIVHAIRQGRILPYKPPKQPGDGDDDEGVVRYDLWANEKPRPDAAHRLPAPKLPPPGYAESYNPPLEYLPTEAERQAWEKADEEDRRRDYLPQRYDALRKVPGYARFVKERFERCLDLYLAPRIRRKKLNIDPESLLPKLPSPEELRPFPTMCATIYRGHDGRVRSVAVDPAGLWLASGGDDGTVRLWELLTGRQVWHVKLSAEDAVNVVRWRPNRDNDTMIIAAAAGTHVYMLVPPVADPQTEAASRAVLDAGWGHAAANGSSSAAPAVKAPVAQWSRPGGRVEQAGALLRIALRSPVKVLSWHRRGDYFVSVAPQGQTQAVAVHTLSRHLTQVPFRRLKGLAQWSQFHPAKPVLFVATQRRVRAYDLLRQELVKVLQPGARWISAFDVHPGGDNVLVGSYDRRLLWHDLDLSSRPYKTLRYHTKAIRAVKFHPAGGALPLFADASDDGSVQVFHGKVVADLMQNATIVPLKVLRGHQVRDQLGVLDLDWHPREPWCVSAGADGTCRLWM